MESKKELIVFGMAEQFLNTLRRKCPAYKLKV